MYRKVLIDPTFSPLTVFFNQMNSSTLRWLLATKGLSSGGSPGFRGFVTTCESVAFCLHLCFLFLTFSQYPICTKFEIVYPRDLPVSEWVDSKNPGSSNSKNTLKDELLNIVNLTFVRSEMQGSLRLRMSGLKSRAHLIRKYTYPTSLISSSLTQLGALSVQKVFPKPDVDQALQQRKQILLLSVLSRYLHGRAFLSLHFLPLCWLNCVMLSWFAFQNSAI